jgi:hypothetical protein
MTVTNINATANTRVFSNNPTYATARTTATTTSTTPLTIGQAYFAPDFYCFVGFLKFNTVPIIGLVTAVSLTMQFSNNSSDTDFDVQIVKYNWGAYDPITSGNMDTAFDGALVATLDDNIWRNTNGMGINTAYTSAALNNAWVVCGGNTYYAVMSNRYRAGTQNSGSEYIEGTVAPILNVTYTPSGTQAVWFFMKRTKTLWDEIGGIYRPRDLGVTTI